MALVIVTLAALAAVAWVLDPVLRISRPPPGPAARCPICTLPVVPGARYCATCGSALEPTAPPPPADGSRSAAE